jgi:hypothetical protein
MVLIFDPHHRILRGPLAGAVEGAFSLHHDQIDLRRECLSKGTLNQLVETNEKTKYQAQQKLQLRGVSHVRSKIIPVACGFPESFLLQFVRRVKPDRTNSCSLSGFLRDRTGTQCTRIVARLPILSLLLFCNSGKTRDWQTPYGQGEGLRAERP